MRRLIILMLCSTALCCHPIYVMVCNPRSVSTAIERSFMERGDLKIFHEPFQQVFLHRVLGDQIVQKLDFEYQSLDYSEVTCAIMKAAKQQAVFVKDMSNAVCDFLKEDPSWLQHPDIHFFFLIRNPARTIESNYRAILHRFPRDIPKIGLWHRFDLQYELSQTVDDPLIIDADDFLTCPESMLPKICDKLGVDFKSAMLSWQPRMPREWVPFAPFHQDAANSSKFMPAKPLENRFQHVLKEHLSVLEDAYQKMLPFYEKLYELRLKN